MRSARLITWRAALCVALLGALALPAGALASPASRLGPFPRLAAGSHSGALLTALAADDNIPGVTIPASPVTGTLDPVTDMDDVYAITLAAGDKLAVRLNGDAGTLFAAGLFPPTATDVMVDEPVVWAGDGVYPSEFTYVVHTPGVYFIDLYSAGGLAGNYTLQYEIQPVGPDDEIPGVALPSSPATGTLAMYGDIDDVFSIALSSGESARFTMTGDPGTDFDLYAYSPTATVVWTDPTIADSDQANIYPEIMTLSPGAAGTYYFDVHAFSGTGEYTFSYERGALTAMSISGPKSTAWNTSTAINGVLSEAGVGPLAGREVRIEQMAAGASAWTLVATSTTDVNGAWRQSVRPARQTRYRAVWAGESMTRLSATSKTLIVTPRAVLTAPTAPSTVAHGVAFTSYGFITPKYKPGDKPIAIKAYRLENHKWVLRKTVMATYTNAASYGNATKYSAKFALPSTGKWRLLAYSPSTIYSYGTQSASRYLTVR